MPTQMGVARVRHAGWQTSERVEMHDLQRKEGEGVMTIAIQVIGGVVYVLGATKPCLIRLEDTDNGETTVYHCQGGTAVYAVEDEDVQFEVEKSLEEILNGD